MSGKGEESCKDMRKWIFDVCCLLEVKWRGQVSRMFMVEGGKWCR